MSGLLGCNTERCADRASNQYCVPGIAHRNRESVLCPRNRSHLKLRGRVAAARPRESYSERGGGVSSAMGKMRRNPQPSIADPLGVQSSAIGRWVHAIDGRGRRNTL
jgi:hypothetical protein